MASILAFGGLIYYLSTDPFKIDKITPVVGSDINYCFMHRLVIYSVGKSSETVFNEDINVPVDNEMLTLNGVSKVNLLCGVNVYNFQDASLIQNTTELDEQLTANHTKIDSMLNKNWFIVNSMNSQITAQGTISGTINGHSSGESCGFLICSVISVETNSNLNADIKLNGEIDTPYSIVNESQFNKISNQYPNNFVKCILVDSDTSVTINEDPVKKVVCGLEKDGLIVMSEIKSLESPIKSCSNSQITIGFEPDAPHYKTIKFVPTGMCGELWGKNATN